MTTLTPHQRRAQSRECWPLVVEDSLTGIKETVGSTELTDQGLPLAIGLGDLIHAAHLAVRHPTYDKDNDPGPRLHLCGAPVLVPVTIASTATCETGK